MFWHQNYEKTISDGLSDFKKKLKQNCENLKSPKTSRFSIPRFRIAKHSNVEKNYIIKTQILASHVFDFRLKLSSPLKLKNKYRNKLHAAKSIHAETISSAINSPHEENSSSMYIFPLLWFETMKNEFFFKCRFFPDYYGLLMWVMETRSVNCLAELSMNLFFSEIKLNEFQFSLNFPSRIYFN